MPGRYRNIQNILDASILAFSQNMLPLLGIATAQRRQILTLQIIDSLRRSEFPRAISQRPVSATRADPTNALFDPLRAAVHFRNIGSFDEAHWIAFLGTHCGKHERYGWRLAAALYGGFQSPALWSWNNISVNLQGFLNWLANNQYLFLNIDNHYHFSNHRKYESLDVTKQNHTGLVIASYVNWINRYGGHAAMLNAIQVAVGQNPTEIFDSFYTMMNTNVVRFGRLGAFDHVCMLGKLYLAPLVPGKTYIANATGPRKGARLLIDGARTGPSSSRHLEETLVRFGAHIGIGMQELEDSLCNWQKDPDNYVHYVG